MTKSGFKTSEYIPVLASMITFILVSTGVIRGEDSTNVEEVISMGISGIVAVILAISYILSRTEIKKEEIRAGAVPVMTDESGPIPTKVDIG